MLFVFGVSWLCVVPSFFEPTYYIGFFGSSDPSQTEITLMKIIASLCFFLACFSFNSMYLGDHKTIRGVLYLETAMCAYLAFFFFPVELQSSSKKSPDLYRFIWAMWIVLFCMGSLTLWVGQTRSLASGISHETPQSANEYEHETRKHSDTSLGELSVVELDTNNHADVTI